MLSRVDDERNTFQFEPIVVPNDPMVNKPAESNVEISLRRFQRVRKLVLSNN